MGDLKKRQAIGYSVAKRDSDVRSYRCRLGTTRLAENPTPSLQFKCSFQFCNGLASPQPTKHSPL